MRFPFSSQSRRSPDAAWRTSEDDEPERSGTLTLHCYTKDPAAARKRWERREDSLEELETYMDRTSAVKQLESHVRQVLQKQKILDIFAEQSSTSLFAPRFSSGGVSDISAADMSSIMQQPGQAAVTAKWNTDACREEREKLSKLISGTTEMRDDFANLTIWLNSRRGKKVALPTPEVVRVIFETPPRKDDETEKSEDQTQSLITLNKLKAPKSWKGLGLIASRFYDPTQIDDLLSGS